MYGVGHYARAASGSFRTGARLMTDVAIASTALRDREGGDDLAPQLVAERKGGAIACVIPD